MILSTSSYDGHQIILYEHQYNLGTKITYSQSFS